MWKIWKEEIYKIASRKMVWAGMILLMVFVKLRLSGEVRDYTVAIGGEMYQGKAAIEMDRKLAAEYAGPLTKEKVKQIYEDFGFFYYDQEKGYTVGNFCSRFITERMTNYKQTEEDGVEEIHFLEGENWELFVEPLLDGKIRFDYTYGWADLKEMFVLISLLLFVIVLVGLAPVFAEEYSLRTADLLLTTEKGKKGGIWMKILASLFMAVLVYLVMAVFLFGTYIDTYGVQGLDASAVMVGLPNIGYHPDTVWGFFFYIFLAGLVGVLLLAGMTLAVSSLCKSSFLAVVFSLILFVVPYVWMEVGAILLEMVLGRELIGKIGHFMVSMPLYLPMNWGFAFSGKQIVLHVGTALVMGTGCIILGYYKYRNYQGNR